MHRFIEQILLRGVSYLKNNISPLIEHCFIIKPPLKLPLH